MPFLRLRSFVCCLLSLGFAAATAHADRLGSARLGLENEPVRPPGSWQTRRDYSRIPVSRAIGLRPIPEDEAAARLEPGKPGTPFQIGFSRALPEALRGDLAGTAGWTELPGGGRVASFSVHSPGAGSLRLAVRAVLPDGARMRFFAPGGTGARYPVFKWSDFVEKARPIGGAAAENRPRTRWSPSLPGDVAGVEIEIPPDSDPSEVSFRVVGLSHIHPARLDMPRPAGRSPKSGAVCEPVQAVCKALPDCPSSAVAILEFTADDGDSYVCTGTAVNSTRPRDENFDAPFVLTAQHCIDSQRVADTVETTWHYEYSTCGGSELRSGETVGGGADLLANDADSDGSLLRLRLADGLPDGVCLAAWDASGGWRDGAEVYSLHHPQGDVREWAGGAIEGTGRSLFDEGVVDTIDVVWSEGQTLGGSSGAGLFAAGGGDDDVLIGVLSGGPPQDCTKDSYGRLDRFFANQAGVHLLPTDPPPTDDHGGSADVATGVLAGSETAGRIDDGTDADVFRIEIVEPGTLTVYTTGAVDTFGRLKREDGSVIAFNDDDAGYESNFRIEAEVETGTYYVKVTGYDHTEVGAYRLHVEFVSAAGSREVLVPLFLSASAWETDGRQGFVRVFNRSGSSGEVRVTAIDDSGTRAGPVTLSIRSSETRAFNSQDLEEGNAGKGLSGGVGPGMGDWRLEFESDLDIEVAAYIRTRDGFLTAMHDLVVFDDHWGAYHVPLFNPASNTNQRSRLRLINADADDSVNVTIDGYDDNWDRGASRVELRLLPGSVHTLNAGELENGGPDLTGRLGDGDGKWRLFIEADGKIHVVNLLDSVSGDLTNLSLPGGNNHSR